MPEAVNVQIFGLKSSQDTRAAEGFFKERRVPIQNRDLAPKLALYLAMREQGMRNTELAKRLGISETVVRRLLDPKHNTKPEKIQAALAALGKRIVVRFEDAA
jgi:antitoxin HicB